MANSPKACCSAVKNTCLRPRAPAVSGANPQRAYGRLDHINGGIPAAHRRSLIEGGFVVVVKVAAMNKCLARSNKSRALAKATKKREIRQSGLIDDSREDGRDG